MNMRTKLSKVQAAVAIASLLASFFVGFASPVRAATDPVINEFVFNHTGSDTEAFIEVFGDPSTDYSGFTVLEIEGDSSGAGTIDAVLSVDTTNTGGFWTDDEDVENGTVTLLLVEGFSGSAGTDLDTDNDGTLDATPWTRIVDDVAVHDGGSSDRAYSSVVLTPNYDGLSPYAPGGASRIPNGTDTDSVSDWVRNDFDGAGFPGFTGTPDPGEALNTPGAPNQLAVSATDPLINEFVFNHTGSDTEAFIEVFGDPSTDYSGFTVLEIEGDSSGAGTIDAVLSVDTTNTGGFWTDDEDVENGTVTLLLVEGFSGSAGTDLDTDNDGTLDATPWTRIVDDVAIHDGGSNDRTYSSVVLAGGFDGNSYTPGGASRIPNGTDTDAVDDWVRNDFDLAGIPGFTGSPEFGEAFNTPGAVNEAVPEPAEMCGDPFTAIYAVQGSGSASPLDGSVVSVEGIVTGDFQGSDELRGFFIQDPAGDGDTSTSDGIFVYDGSDPAVDVAVGDLVRVRGTVDEYYELTEITSVELVLSCGTGGVGATAIDLPVPFDLEPYEGMLVTFPEELTASQNYFQGRYGQVTMSSEGRLFNPTNTYRPLTPEAITMAEENLRRMFVLDDGTTSQNPYPIPYIGDDDTLRAGDTVAGLTGVVDYGPINSSYPPARYYRVHPTEPVEFTRVNGRTAEPDNVGGVIKIASFNVLNYFNGDGMGGGFPTSRGADTPEEFTRQRTKIISAIVAMDADVIGLMEIENDGYDAYSAIADLVNGLNDATGSSTYAFIDPGVAQVGTDEIAVGFIYQPGTVTLVGVAAILDSSVDPDFNSDYNRPAIAQTFERSTGGGRFTAAVNHLKSKGSPCDAIGDPDIGDGQGNCNLTRKAAAIALTNWLAADPTGSGDPDFFIIGDLNSYAMEDPIIAIEDAGYANLVKAFGGTWAYSYIFDGQAGYLDHALASPGAVPQVSGATVWHINTDEPSVIDYNVEYKSEDLYTPTPYLSSDHDPVLVGFCDAVPPVVEVSVVPDTLWPPNHKYVTVQATVDVSDNIDPNPTLTLVSVTSNEPDDGLGDGDTPDDIVIVDDFTFKLRAERSGTGDGRVYTITYQATDACGNSTVATATVTVPHSKGKGK